MCTEFMRSEIGPESQIHTLMEKIRMRAPSFGDMFEEFLADKRSEGCVDVTVSGYRGHFGVWCKYVPASTPMNELTTTEFKRSVSEMARSGLSPNSIRSYTATMKSFLSWARAQGLSDAEIRLFKGEEGVPECYSSDELKRLLKRPNLRSCTFAEYRNWVIVNLLVSDGCRASTVREIQIRDVFLDESVIFLRHMKAKKAISIPLGEYMVSVLRQYLRIRGGSGSDPLFPTVDNQKMTAAGLRVAIERYNQSRGVERTGLHKFRHTFARMFLVECGGDPIRLQKVLGHSTLKMTQHYARIYDAELVRDFQDHSPLDRLMVSQTIKMPPSGSGQKARKDPRTRRRPECGEGGKTPR